MALFLSCAIKQALVSTDSIRGCPSLARIRLARLERIASMTRIGSIRAKRRRFLVKRFGRVVDSRSCSYTTLHASTMMCAEGVYRRTGLVQEPVPLYVLARDSSGDTPRKKCTAPPVLGGGTDTPSRSGEHGWEGAGAGRAGRAAGVHHKLKVEGLFADAQIVVKDSGGNQQDRRDQRFADGVSHLS